MTHQKCPRCGKYTVIYDNDYRKWRCRSRDCLFIIPDTEHFTKKIKSQKEDSPDQKVTYSPL